MSDLRIRRMKTADLEAVYNLNCQVFPEPWSRQSFSAELAEKQKSLLHVAYLDGNLAAYSSCCLLGNEAELMHLAVAPNRRRCGIADKLLHHVSDTVYQSGVDTLYLEVRNSNCAARSLYEKHGFEAVGQRPGYYALDSEDAVLMRKFLKEG